MNTSADDCRQRLLLTTVKDLPALREALEVVQRRKEKTKVKFILGRIRVLERRREEQGAGENHAAVERLGRSSKKAGTVPLSKA